MGILDEAIREHLELKRRHGAGESELQQLEDEAFGPPARPGEPDFPAPPAAESEEAERPSTSDFAAALQPTEEVEVPPSEVDEEEEEEVTAWAAPAGEPEQTAMEHPILEAPEAEAAPEAEEPAGEAVAGEEEEAGFGSPPVYDHAGDAALDLGELDLELDEEFGSASEDEAGGKGVAAVDEAEAEPADVAPEPSEPEELSSELEEPAAEPEEGEAPEDDAEDVLEETPEFLQDRPEDDELWFEQGKPKDFDF